MRACAAVSTLLLATGCASLGAAVAPSDPSRYASLIYVPARNLGDAPHAELVTHVDSETWRRDPSSIIYLSPRKHLIGINCTPYVFTGEQPSITHRFKAGVKYELYCRDGAPIIEAK